MRTPETVYVDMSDEAANAKALAVRLPRCSAMLSSADTLDITVTSSAIEVTYIID